MVSTIVELDRKSTRLNSSHVSISYAVFCLKKKRNVTLSRAHLGHRVPDVYHCCNVRWAHSWCRGLAALHLGVNPSDCACGAFFFLMRRDPPNSSPFPLPAAFRS